MIAHQGELEFAERVKERTGFARDVALLETILKARTAMPWMTRAQIAAHVLSVHHREWSERYVRVLASESRAIASAPGTPGYAFADLLPVEQLAHAAAALISQGRAMMKRGIHLRRAVALKAKASGVLATTETEAGSKL